MSIAPLTEGLRGEWVLLPLVDCQVAALQQVPAHARWVDDVRTAMERLRFL
ncbi:hypothetical protein [Streptomyces sp. NPDC002276]